MKHRPTMKSAAVKSAGAETSAMEDRTAAMKSRPAVKTTTVESGASATMEATTAATEAAGSAVETSTSTAAVEAATTATTSGPANLNGGRIGRLRRSWSRAGTDQRHRLCWTIRHRSKREHRGCSKAEAANQATSRISCPHHCHFSLSASHATESVARIASPLVE